jgi:iron complex outermembrane recepter protein
MNFTSTGKLLLATTALTLGGLSASAQQAGTPDGSSVETDRKLAPVIVTAQRKEQNLQDVAASVTAVDAAAMEKRQILSPIDLSRIAPNVKFGSVTGGTAGLSPYIRGGGVTDGGFVTSESEVAIYMNDVYVARLQGAMLDFAEVERVEVLRGPQGVLYGRNASAGAVNIITKTPSEDPSGSVQVGYGSWNERRVKGYYSTPLDQAGKWRAAVNGIVRARDGGRQYNATLGNDVGEEEFFGVQGDLAYETEGVEARLNVFHVNGETDGQWAVSTTTNSDGDVVPVSGSYFTVLSPKESSTTVEQSGISLNVSAEFPGGTLKSITGYSELEDYWFQDFSGGVPSSFLNIPGDAYLSLFERSSDSSQSQFSQEFQASGDFASGAFEYVAGAYFFEESADQDIDSLIFFGPSSIDLSTSTESVALYGQLTYLAMEDLELLVGGRYTDEEKSLNGAYNGDPATDTSTYTKFTPKLGVNYKVTPDTLIYASYSEGFKAGGYNAFPSSAAQLALPFRPQHTKAYEVGLKADFGDALRLNLSAFYNDIEDRQQGALLGNGVAIVENYDVELKGLEVEATWVATDALTFWGNAALNEGEYVGTDSELASILENEVPSLPDYEYTIGFDYAVRLGGGELNLGGDYNYRDDYFSTADNYFVGFVGQQETLNGYISYNFEQWKFQIAGKNLLQEESWQTGFGFSVVNPRFATDPRSVLATVRYSY